MCYLRRSSKTKRNMENISFYVLVALIHYSLQEESQGPSVLQGPSDLIILDNSERGIRIEWSPVELNGVKRYHVTAEPVNEPFMNQMREWKFGSNTNSTNVLGLEPGTQYNISVFAATDYGNTKSVSKLVWTDIAAPNKPLPVEVIKQEGSVMHVKLHPESGAAKNTMNIKVIVIEKSALTLFSPEQLKNYSEAKKFRLPFYITAELSPEEAAKIFIVGDGKIYKRYYNAPLTAGKEYEIIQGTTNILNGVTKSSFSALDTPNVAAVEVNMTSSSSGSLMTVILATAIGIFGFLLLASFVLYYLLRQHYGKRRLSDELVLNIQGSESENGSVPGALQVEDTDLCNYFETLKERYWHIPKNHLDIHQTVLGKGRFGEVREAIVYRKSHGTSSLVQKIHVPSEMGEKERKNMLLELEAMIHLTVHPYIVEFIGIYEEPDLLYVVIENYVSTARGRLLRSRQQIDGYMCCLSAAHLIEILIAVAQGMIHLSDCGILHRHLSSRSIVIDGNIPKISNFGLGSYNPPGKELDFTRWTAPESLKSAMYTVKSDVWSFGILMWEICALGGTPYVTIPKNEIQSRILQGMRLHQLKGVSDELYQLMLHCWEFDFDERPTFQELAAVLQNILVRAKDHVRLNVYPGFCYEMFDPLADEI